MGFVMPDSFPQNLALSLVQSAGDATQDLSGGIINREGHLYHTLPYYHTLTRVIACRQFRRHGL